MKLALIVPARDKAAHVHKAVTSCFQQGYGPMEIILSDQGSKDDTYAIMEAMVRDYTGGNKVRLLRCPETEARGMEGLNAHLRWIHEQTDADWFILISADDVNHPDRAARTAEVIEKYNPSMVGTAQQFCNSDGSARGITKFSPHKSCWVSPMQMIDEKVGGSSSVAWSRDLWEKYGGLTTITISDVALPFWSTIERGYYFIDQQLVAYMEHAEINNAGLGGRMRAAKGKDEKLQILELIHFHITQTYSEMAAVAEHTNRHRLEDRCYIEAMEAVYLFIIRMAREWAGTRLELSRRGIPPMKLIPDIRRVYFTDYEQCLVDKIRRGGDRFTSLQNLITDLYEFRDEPEWPEPAVKVLLGRARKKLEADGQELLVNVRRRGYRIEPVNGGLSQQSATQKELPK